MKPFDELTIRGRARRLREVARRALCSYDIDVERIRLVNNIANCTFRVDSTGGRSYALRVNLPGMRTVDEIRSELIWQEAICRDTDIVAPVPVRSRNGDLVVQAEVPDVPEPRLCNLSTWVRGRTLSRYKTTRHFEWLGELSARLHGHGAAFTPPPGFSVPRLDTVLPPDTPDLLFGSDPGYEIPNAARAFMKEVRAALEAEFRRLYRSGTPQIVHGDLHWWNVLVERRTLHPIDFEDCSMAFPIQDIAITFYYVLWDERYRCFVNAFRNGYERHREWPEEYPGQLDLLLGQRALELINLLLNSTYLEDREFIPELIDIVDRVYRRHFERWKAQRS